MFIREAWSELLPASSSNRIFFTHEWFQCWWESFGNNHNLFIIAAWEGERLKGIAPLYLKRSFYRGLPVQKLQFMANGYSEECGFILSSANDKALLAILSYLGTNKAKWDMLELSSIREENMFLGSLLSNCPPLDFRYTQRKSKQIPFIPINCDWNTYLATRSRRFKKAFRARNNVIAKHANPVKVTQLKSSAEILAALPSILEISSQSWKAKNKRAITHDPQAKTFFQKLSSLFPDKNWLSLWVLQQGSTPIAFEYHLTYNGITSPIRADFNENFKNISPGAYLEAWIIQTLFDDSSKKITEYNTCADEYTYTLRWTDRIRPLQTIRIFSPKPYSMLVYLFARIQRPVKEKKMAAKIISCRP